MANVPNQRPSFRPQQGQQQPSQQQVRPSMPNLESMSLNSNIRPGFRPDSRPASAASVRPTSNASAVRPIGHNTAFQGIQRQKSIPSINGQNQAYSSQQSNIQAQNHAQQGSSVTPMQPVRPPYQASKTSQSNAISQGPQQGLNPGQSQYPPNQRPLNQQQIPGTNRYAQKQLRPQVPVSQFPLSQQSRNANQYSPN